MLGLGLKIIYKATYIYLAMPLLVFLLSWLSYGWAVVYSCLFLFAFYKAYQSIDTSSADWKLDMRATPWLLILACVWCFFAGIGYFYYQSFDYHFRNAVFRDLINYDWPVMYDKADTPMVYYMAFWLVPATLAKFSALFIESSVTNFMVANVYLFIYAVCGVVLIFMQLAAAVKARGIWQVIIAAMIFMAFSGLDVVGDKFFRVQEQPFAFHLDWWATFMQYSSFSTGMFWVFNQFIPITLLTLLVYNERNIKKFGFLIALSLFFSPYPTAGIGFLMVAYAIYKFCESQDRAAFVVSDIFSVMNIIGVFILLPVMVLYFITNSEGMEKLWYIFDYTTPKRLIIFMGLEFLLYAAVLFWAEKKNIFFITAVCLLLLIPFFRVDQQNNFCMRASIPGLVILAVCVINYLRTSFDEKRNSLGSTILLIMLAIGSVTPFYEFYRGIYYTRKTRQVRLVADDIYTLNQAYVRMPVFGWDANHQFSAKTYQTDVFWQILAKKNKP